MAGVTEHRGGVAPALLDTFGRPWLVLLDTWGAVPALLDTLQAGACCYWTAGSSPNPDDTPRGHTRASQRHHA